MRATFDKSAIMQLLTTIVRDPSAHEELMTIIRDQGITVKGMLAVERMEITNGRLQAVPDSLFAKGFQLSQHVSRVQAWDDAAHVASVYYREIESVAKAATGAKYAFCNGHMLRKSGDSTG